jgi:hypothetical protein
MKMKINAYTAAVILLVVFGALTGISLAIKTVDVSTIPVEMQGVWQGIVYIFTTSSVAPLFVFIRNVYGYYINKAQLKPEERNLLQYEANRLAATWLTYECYIKGIMIMVVALIRKSFFDIAKPVTPST